jgi:hypothetical protein
MRKLSLHLAIACCTFGLSVFLTSIWNWGTHADIRVTVYDEKLDSLSSVSKYELDICAKRDGRWQIQSTTQIN